MDIVFENAKKVKTSTLLANSVGLNGLGDNFREVGML